MNGRERALAIMERGAVDRLPFMPITMMFAAAQIGASYRGYGEGPRIQSWINGVAAIAYTEKDGKIPRDGRLGFQAVCMACHQVKGEGPQIGPDLSGAGGMGVESLLRNILTPNAQLESGYYRHDVTLVDDALLTGFLAAEDAQSVTLRQVGADERIISRKEIKAHTTSRHSLMPEGLIESLGEEQVTDLFAYLRTLK